MHSLDYHGDGDELSQLVSTNYALLKNAYYSLVSQTIIDVCVLEECSVVKFRFSKRGLHINTVVNDLPRHEFWLDGQLAVAAWIEYDRSRDQLVFSLRDYAKSVREGS